jgi:hypothetical protein
MPSGEAASCSSWASVIPGCSFWQLASACLAAAICAGVGLRLEVVLDVVWVAGAAPPVEAAVVVGGGLCAGAGALWVVVVVVFEEAAGAVVLVAGVAGVLAAGVVAGVEVVWDFEPPQPASARMVRVAITVRFIAPR